MNTQEIRRKFLNYFKNNGHAVVSSSPVIPHDDPTLLFINAGMNQFKDVFLGHTTRDYTRATTSQKCIRAGGKHNDLDNVGHTTRHLTFFEMLGNFSFGDYFKEDAIKFAWELSTEVFGFDPDFIWPSVYLDDDEAFDLWTKYVPAARISRMGEEDNYWSMGDTGPCGPCTELYYDRGGKGNLPASPADDPEGLRFLEFWNLVFMQFNKDASGTKTPLPMQSVDTGAGIERVVSIIENVDSVFETDILRGLIAQVENISGIKYEGVNHKFAPAYHVIADHLRCLSFAIADGAQPSNVDRGYVLRKILRRAVRYGRTLGLDKPFLADVFPRLLDSMGDDYPELKQSQTRIEEILTSEEEAFLRTLRRGGNILNQIIDEAHEKQDKISGDDAFKLKDTYGLPLDEILLIAHDADLHVDTERFEVLEGEARERSRAVHKTTAQIAGTNLFAPLVEKHGETSFVGYDKTEAAGKVLAIVLGEDFVDSLAQGQEGFVVLDQTPFYAEKGGQVGDTGSFAGDSSDISVTDCQEPYKGVIAHTVKVDKGSLKVGDSVKATVDAKRRQRIANNHTATHLLHWALHRVLGEHVKQAGSVVDTERLRFDFSHHKAMTPEEIRQCEDLVNAKIRDNAAVSAYELSYEDAQKSPDIKQFFGDKYGSVVRVVDIDFSKELCGGTHTSAAGNIGYFRISKESSIAAGVRRIEAVTGPEAEAIARADEDALLRLCEQLKTQPAKLETRVLKLAEDYKALQKQLEQAQAAARGDSLRALAEKAEDVNGIKMVTGELPVAAKELRSCAETVLRQLKSGVAVLAAKDESSCGIIVAVSQDLVDKGIKASEVIKQIAPLIDGSGGGKPQMAQAGGKAPEKINEALEKSREVVKSLVAC